MKPAPQKDSRSTELKSLRLNRSPYSQDIKTAITKGLKILLAAPKFPTVQELIALADNAIEEVLTGKKKKSLHKLEKFHDQIKEVTTEIISWSIKQTKKFDSEEIKCPNHLRIALAIPGHDIRTNLAIFLAAFENFIEELKIKKTSEQNLRSIKELCLPKIIKNLPLYETLITQISFILSEGMSNFQGVVPIKDLKEYAPQKDIYTSRYRRKTDLGSSQIERINLTFEIKPEIAELTSTEHFAMHQFLRNAKRFAKENVICEVLHIAHVKVLAVIDDGLGVYDGAENTKGTRGKPLESTELNKIFHNFTTSSGGLGLDAVAFSAKLSSGAVMVISKTNNGTFVGTDGANETFYMLDLALQTRIIQELTPHTTTGASFLYISV